MKKAIVTLSFLFGTLLSVSAQDAPKWNIDPMHSHLGFVVTHFFSEVDGQFNDFNGQFYINPDNIQKSSISFTVKVNSIDTDSEKRDGHLMTGDFFDAENYPEMKFVSTGFKKTGDNKYLAIGKLTIKDVTKEVEIPFQILGVMDHPMMQGSRLMGVKFTYELMRTAYNVGSGQWAMTKVVGDKVAIDIDMELISKK